MALERHAVAFAREQWAAAREKLEGYLDAFALVELNVEHSLGLVDRKLADELLDLCRKYALVADEALRLQEKIAERNRKDPPDRRVKGSGYDLWFEVFAAPQREAISKMRDHLELIAKKFPAAVLVLGDLPAEVRTAASKYDRVKASMKLESSIYYTLRDLLSQVKTLEASLSMPAATDALADLVQPLLTEPRDFTRLKSLRLPPGGIEQQIMDLVFNREEREQRLLANLDLLSSLNEDPAQISPGSWEHVVLFQYSQRLSEAAAQRAQRDKAWQEFWSILGRLAAALGLIALMAIFPFGDAAIAPALASLLALAGSAATIIGVLVLVLHDVIGTLQAAGQLEADAREQLFRLGQTDPEAIQEIGALLSRSRELRAAVGRGLLVTVLTLGAARRLKVVTAAMEFDGFITDVGTLFEPSASDG